MKADIYSYSDRGGREKNEDTCALCAYPDRICAVVADGLGAHGKGKDASEVVVAEMSALGKATTAPDKTDITEAINRANDKITAIRQNKLSMKTTLVCLYLNEKRAIWAHVGDSRLYHFYNYELKDFTLDHSVSQMAVALGEIERKDIPHHSEKNRVLRVVGEEEKIVPDIKEIELTCGNHAFLLCSDGVWEYLQEDEILLDLAKADSARAWIDSLRYRITRRMKNGNDNNTAIAVMIET